MHAAFQPTQLPYARVAHPSTMQVDTYTRVPPKSNSVSYCSKAGASMSSGEVAAGEVAALCN